MTRLDLYSRVAGEMSATVIRRYSSSFGLASRILSRPTRRHIENIYALVRVADEIVDGVATEAGLSAAEAGVRLDELEHETYRALGSGFSTNLVVHAFATTAREVGVERDITAPFFHSMRMDLTERHYTDEEFATYVYGSAEVVGLMCLAVFMRNATPSATDAAILHRGARALGAAFQKVNFLRDLAADVDDLGRSYFPGIVVADFTEADKVRLCDDIDQDLAAAAETEKLLPRDAARAVALARGLFTRLKERIRLKPASIVKSSRIRVGGMSKFFLAMRVLMGIRS